MADLTYDFVIQNSTGNQTLKIINCSNSNVVATINTTYIDGNITGVFTVADNLLNTSNQFKLEVTDGDTVVSSACTYLNCDATYYNVMNCTTSISGILKYPYVINLLNTGDIVKGDDGECYTIVSVTTNVNFTVENTLYNVTYTTCNDCTGGQV